MTERAFIDSSYIVAIAFGESAGSKIAVRVKSFSFVAAHPLLDAEVRSACSREGVSVPEAELETLAWVQVPGLLSAEVNRVLAAGYVRGADCWHLATALFVSPDPRQLTFLTLDDRQRVVARKLGFNV